MIERLISPGEIRKDHAILPLPTLIWERKIGRNPAFLGKTAFLQNSYRSNVFRIYKCGNALDTGLPA